MDKALNRMSVQQMVTAIEMAIGNGRDDLEWMMSSYGPRIRSELGERAWRDLKDRVETYNARNSAGGTAGMLAFGAMLSANRAMKELRNTMVLLGSMAKNGGKMGVLDAAAAFGAVKEINSQIHKLFKHGGK